MSCRVAGKFVESALFAHLLKTEGCEAGQFNVIKTKKNILLRNTLEKIGFTIDGEIDDKIFYTYSNDLLNAEIIEIQ
jgi:predicted enzyme involved in methoxymalonyl-ACP biosynthesis